MVGNFMGDYVKGNTFLRYPESIQKGILLHRKIDSFTDKHPIFRTTKKYFVSDFGLYSGIVVDLFYDHLLAKNWNNFCEISLGAFTKQTHAVLLSHFFYLPKRVQRFLPSLIHNKRLESYQTIEGIQKSLEIMSRYTSLPDKSKLGVKVLEQNMNEIEPQFIIFMNTLIEFANSEKSNLNNNPIKNRE
jgi:acyl carrier protein phosphodiesterase